jgi:hypothetical protein
VRVVLLPASALQEIVSKDVAGKQFLSDSPLVFELSNPANSKKTYAGTHSEQSSSTVSSSAMMIYPHCSPSLPGPPDPGVMEFLADEGNPNAPFWLMQHLELAEVALLPRGAGRLAFTMSDRSLVFLVLGRGR